MPPIRKSRSIQSSLTGLKRRRDRDPSTPCWAIISRPSGTKTRTKLSRAARLFHWRDRPQPDQRFGPATAARQRFAVGRKGERFEAILRAGQSLLQLAGVGIPELDGGVLAATGDGVAVGREGDGIDFELVSFHDVPHLAGVHVPDTDGGVLAAGREQIALGRKGDRLQAARVAFQNALEFASLRIPDARGFVDRKSVV